MNTLANRPYASNADLIHEGARRRLMTADEAMFLNDYDKIIALLEQAAKRDTDESLATLDLLKNARAIKSNIED